MINIYLTEFVSKSLDNLDKKTAQDIRQLFQQIYDSVNQLNKNHDTTAPCQTRRQLAQLAEEMKSVTFEKE